MYHMIEEEENNDRRVVGRRLDVARDARAQPGADDRRGGVPAVRELDGQLARRCSRGFVSACAAWR